MPRVVVKIAGPSGAEQVSLVEPITYARPQGGPTPLGVTTTTSEIAAMRNGAAALGVVSDAGNKLMAALRSQPDVNLAISNMLASANACPLYIELGVGAWEAERMPWESLHDPNQRFLAIYTSNRPVGRRVEYNSPPAVTRAPTRGGGGTAVVKILAVIAAAKRNQHDCGSFNEWDALAKVIPHVANQTAPRLQVEIIVLVADTNLETRIRSKGYANVTVRLLARRSDITDALKNDRPQVVHIYGHGVASGGGCVELANTHDIASGGTTGGISLDANHLTAEKVPVWGVVLNSCETAANPGTAASFAHDLITEWIPWSIGMGEALDASDCHALTEALYPALIDLAEAALPAPGAPANVVEWSPIVRDGRRSMRERTRGQRNDYDAERTDKAWTLPCLYVYPADFLLQRPTLNPASQSKTQTIAAAAATLATVPGMPEDVLDTLWNEVPPAPEGLSHD